MESGAKVPDSVSIASPVMPAPLVNTSNFVRAIRDAGYSNTSSALAELIDDAIDARAKQVSICIEECAPQGESLRVQVLDNGEGMSKSTLAAALQFGGS